MSIQYTEMPEKILVSLTGHLGSIEATIERPDKSVKRKTWGLCFGACIGEAHPLIGKALKRNTLAAVKHDLTRYDRIMNAPYGKAIPGFRGMPDSEPAHG